MADFDASIVAHFGGDTTGLQAAITEADANVKVLEGRFREAGITMGEAPRKFAQESMKAFDALFKAEDQLTSMRVRDDRIPIEQRLAMARKQSLSILEQINATTGNTAGKAALLVEFERKKNVVAELNAQLLKQSTVEVTEQAKQAKDQEKTFGGLGKALDGVKEGFKGIGISLKGAGIGIAFAAIVKSMGEALREAVATREEFERMGKPIDANTAALARFSDALSSVKDLTVTAAGAVLGFVNQAGEFWGSAINRMRGISEEQEKIAESAARNADLLEKQAKAIKDRQSSIEAVRAAAKAADEAEAKAAYERMSNEEKHQTLILQRADLMDKVAQMEATGMQKYTVYHETRNKLAEIENQVRQKGSEIMIENFEEEKKKADAVTVALKEFFEPLDANAKKLAEAAIEAEKIRRALLGLPPVIVEIPPKVEEGTKKVHDQAAAWDKIIGRVQTTQAEVIKLQGIIAGIATSKNFGNESSEVLQERMRRNRGQIAQTQIMSQGAGAGSRAIDRSEIARLEIENQNIKRELDLRSNVARTFASQGRQAALESFGGDPAAFDRFLDLANKQDVSQKLLQKDINGIYTLLKDTLG